MGTVLELKLRVSNDWTSLEKLQLESLVDYLPAKMATDIEFGVTDTGDPWCAVMDASGEVVLHVARIDGRFIVHSTVKPYVADARDLPTAVRPFVGDHFPDRRHMASVTALYGIMPLHAYAQPQTLLEQPTLGAHRDAPADAAAPDAVAGPPEVTPTTAASAFQMADGDSQIALTADWRGDAPEPSNDAPDVAPMSAQLVSDAAAAPDFELTPAAAQGDLNFEPFLRAPEPMQAANDVAPAAAVEHGPPVQTTGAADPDAGANVVAFPPSPSGFGQTGRFDVVDDMVRAATGPAMVISDVEPGVVIDWGDHAPAHLMGVLPSADAF